MNNTWGIDIIDRQMLYNPWKTDINGYYVQPDKKEISEVFGISGEAVAETFTYFKECHGDCSKLITLLNRHINNDRFKVSENTLLDKDYWFTNEFYFYFQMFCKKVIGRYDWHYGENHNIELSAYHKIYEKGLLKFIPYAGEEKDATHAIPYAFMEYYSKKSVDFTDMIEWIEALVIHKTALSYKDDVSKIRDIKLCGEMAYYIYEFLKIRLNKNNLSNCIDEGFEIFNLSGLTFFPKEMIIKALMFISNLSSRNTQINCIKKIDSSTYRCEIGAYEKYKIEKYDKYRKAVFINIHQMFCETIIKVFMKIFNLKHRPEISDITPLGSDLYNFHIKLKHKKVESDYCILCKIGLIMFFLYGLIFVVAEGFYISVFVLLLFTFAIDFYYKRKRRHYYEKRILNMAEDTNQKIQEMEEMSEKLVNEKENLENKIKERTGELREANAVLKNLDTMKTRFYTNISHEIRTPLTLIKSPVESIIEGYYGKTIESKSAVFKGISNNCNRLLHLINSMLDLSKIESGYMTMNKTVIDLHQFIKKCTGFFDSSLVEKNIELQLGFYDSKNMYLECDEELMETLFFNLISNAVKYNKENGKIIVTTDIIDDKIRMKIEDTGVGIPEDQLDIIFDRFIRADNQKKGIHDGSGIGLSLSYEIVKLHNGTISVESKENIGTIFTIELPYYHTIECLENTEDIRKVLSDEIESFIESEQKVAHYTVLLVEDNKELSIYLMDILNKSFNMKHASHGIEALEILHNEKIDLIISDVMMPIMNGYDLMSEILHDNVLKTIPFIFLTARSEINEKLDCLSKGAIDYIEKPFNVNYLKEKINNLLCRENIIKKKLTSRILSAVNDVVQTEENKRILEVKASVFDEYKLSDKEFEIAIMIVNGISLKEIAYNLNKSLRTVQYHITGIYKKTGTSNRFELLNIVKR